jgi:hypothetical protein
MGEAPRPSKSGPAGRIGGRGSVKNRHCPSQRALTLRGFVNVGRLGLSGVWARNGVDLPEASGFGAPVDKAVSLKSLIAESALVADISRRPPCGRIGDEPEVLFSR